MRPYIVYRISCIVLVLLVFCLHPTPYTLHPIYAADSTPSADIQSKLKALQTEIASKAAQLKMEVNKKLQNRAYVGTILEIGADQLNLQLRSTTQTVSINQFTDFQGKGITSFKSFSKGDYIVAVGDVDENGTMTARKIIKTSKPDTIQKNITWGEVILKADKSFIIKLPEGVTHAVNVGVGTSYKVGKDEGSWDDIKLNKDLIVVILKTDQGETARFVYILPYSIKLKVKPATPSAQTATSSSNKR